MNREKTDHKTSSCECWIKYILQMEEFPTMKVS